MESYNGYSATERLSKLKAMNRLLASGELAPAAGPCDLCGDSDPSARFEYHDEDYGAPPIWGMPAQYCLCLHCHRFKIHRRFVEVGQVPALWLSFLAHVRRGGYARDLKIPSVKAEVAAYRLAVEENRTLPILSARNGGYSRTTGEEWFATLRTDKACLVDPKARARPFDPDASFEAAALRRVARRHG